MADTFIKIEGFDALVKTITRGEHGVLSKALMSEIATYLIHSIKKRTGEGTDAEGRPFEPYHPDYRFFREANDHQGSPVNLFYSGGMLGSMTYKSSKSQAKIFFMNTSVAGQTVTNPEKAFYNQQSRNFFAISSQEREGVINIVRDFVRRSL